MPERLRDRLEPYARDGNLDVEDLDAVLAADTPSAELRESLDAWASQLEPAARAYLGGLLADPHTRAPNRVLLAPVERGQPLDLYQPRAEVVRLQTALATLGQSLTIDGDYGPGTARAVATVQTAGALPATGIVDSRTLRLINEHLRDRGSPPLDLNPRGRIRPDHVVACRDQADPDVEQALCAGLSALADHTGREELRPSARFDQHTERALARFQQSALLPATGLLDTATRDALNAALELVQAAPIPDERPTPSTFELHFYPGPHALKLLVLREGREVERYAMVGGQEKRRADPNNPGVDYDPSPPGAYEVVEVSPHASGVWARSYVPYGAALRAAGAEVEFQDARGVWRLATGPNGVFAGRNPPPGDRYLYLDPKGRLLPFWTGNDFGHLRARLRSTPGGALQTHMIHPSGYNEGNDVYWADSGALLDPKLALDVLHWSHGCEHIHPRDMDELVSKGYLRPGTRFVVHGYDAHPPPG